MARVYLPEVFTDDAKECDPNLFDLWQRVLAAPRVRRGAGHGRWVDLTPDEAAAIRKEAEYRADYWLVDMAAEARRGGDPLSPRERTRGRAARRVAEALR